MSVWLVWMKRKRGQRKGCSFRFPLPKTEKNGPDISRARQTAEVFFLPFLITRAPRRGMNESSTVPVSGSGVGSGLFLNVATAVNCLLPAPGEEGLGMGGGLIYTSRVGGWVRTRRHFTANVCSLAKEYIHLAGGTLNRGTSPTMSLPLPPNVCRALRDVKSCCCWMLG